MRRSYNLFVRTGGNNRLSHGRGVGSSGSISFVPTFRRWNHSLALSVHFYHPALGMKSHEILSRATAFLLSVDPPSSEISKAIPVTSPYDHLQTSREERALKLLKQDYNADPAGGPPRDAKQLGWLEFCPRRNRPTAHVIAASHVLSPWNWPNYYPQDWLTQIKQEHVTYSLEVFKDNEDGKPLAKFACNPYPIHHPEGADLAIIHLKQEETALKHMEKLGIEIMHLTPDNYVYERNQTVHFEGFEVAEEAEGDVNNADGEKKTNNKENDDDVRIFKPFEEKGNLTFASPTRFLAKTSRPLPEGLCGGPCLLTPDKNNLDTNKDINPTTTVCGVIEGIVPIDHEDKKLAGAAAFLPAIQVRNFIEYAEKEMLQQIVPEKLFQKIVDIKEGKGLSGDVFNDGKEFSEGDIDESLQKILQTIRKTNTPEQADAIFSTIEREKQEIMDILLREGGDVDEVIARVRQKTRQRQKEIIEKLNDMHEAEILNSDKKKDEESPTVNSK